MLIPDGELPNWPQLAVNGEKEGGLWFMDRNSPGHHDVSHDSNCNPAQQTTDKNVQVYWAGTGGLNGGPPFHTSPAYWEYDKNQPNLNYLFISQQQVKPSVNGLLTRYPLCATSALPIDFTTCPGTPLSAVDNFNNPIDWGWGATPSISANGEGASDAVVWAISKPDKETAEGTIPGILYAIDAVSMTQLYSSTNSACAGDEIYSATKFSVPTVANGYVYLGAQSQNLTQQSMGLGTFYIFGLNRPLNC